MAVSTGWMPGAPITLDQFRMLSSDNVVAPGKDGLLAMGIAPTSLDAVASDWLDIYRKHGRFGGNSNVKAKA
jgi:hypothetical protein